MDIIITLCQFKKEYVSYENPNLFINKILWRMKTYHKN